MHLNTVLFDKPNDPINVKALQRRATAYTALGQPAKAVADFKKAAEIEPGNAEVRASYYLFAVMHAFVVLMAVAALLLVFDYLPEW